jgi:hypothetical protein
MLNSMTDILLLQGPPDKVAPAGNHTGSVVVIKKYSQELFVKAEAKFPTLVKVPSMDMA